MATAEYLGATYRHLLLLQRTSVNMLDETLKLLDERDRKVIRRLLRYDDPNHVLTRRQAESIVAFVDETDAAWATDTGQALSSHYQQLAGVEATWTKQALDVFLGAEEKVRKIRITRATVGRAFNQVYSNPGQKTTVADDLRATIGRHTQLTKNEIRRGWQEGYSVSQMVENLKPVTGATQRNLETVVRSATNAVSNQVRDETYRANSNIIERLVWVSTLDGRTSRYCAFMDGTYLPLDSGPRPPGHPRCRSTTIPLLAGETLEDLGPRASRGSNTSSNRDSLSNVAYRRGATVGPTKTYVTYEDWLKRQSAQFQDHVLGRERGALFRRGGLSFDDMVKTTKEGYFKRPLSLEELEAAESAAFEAANL